jgi:hypothetical protein
MTEYEELLALRDVLEKWGYPTIAKELEEELHDLENEVATWKDETKELDSLRERYREEI